MLLYKHLSTKGELEKENETTNEYKRGLGLFGKSTYKILCI
jgi:hypothetical protein